MSACGCFDVGERVPPMTRLFMLYKSNQPLPILIPGATSLLSHGPVTVHLVTADLSVQVSHDHDEAMARYCVYFCLELLVEGVLVCIICHLLGHNTGSMRCWCAILLVKQSIVVQEIRNTVIICTRRQKHSCYLRKKIRNTVVIYTRNQKPGPYLHKKSET